MSDTEDDGGYGSYESDSEFCDDRDGFTQEEILVIVLSTALFAYSIPLEPPRIGNCHNSRPEALQYVRSWDDDMFRRQFRLCREDFGFILKLIDPLIRRNEIKAIASSGSSICPEMRLMITLRILAGAKYLDMIWYRVNVDHVSDYVADCLEAINSVLNNVNIPATESEWMHETEQFREVLHKKHGSLGDDMLGGVCGAGDGLVIQITEPTGSNGESAKNYMNRKGFFALLVQAFCGAYTKFWYFNVGWPGATNDITAYKQTPLYFAAVNNRMPDWVSFLLDEAYSSCGGRHLTPFSGHQLRRANADSDKTSYFQMRTFNHVLSSQRITIERSFGQLVRRFGILWCANSSHLNKVAVLVLVCAKLHNLCVDRWMINGRRGNLDIVGVNEDIPLHDGIENNRPTDIEVANALGNRYSEIGDRAAVSDLRTTMMLQIWSTGIRITSENDLIGLPTVTS